MNRATVLTQTDLARIFRRVMGGNRASATELELMREVEAAALAAPHLSLPDELPAALAESSQYLFGEFSRRNYDAMRAAINPQEPQS